MGDVGRLFLGGLIAALVVAGGLKVWFVPLTLIYIVETLSVGSRRIVKMPLSLGMNVRGDRRVRRHGV